MASIYSSRTAYGPKSGALPFLGRNEPKEFQKVPFGQVFVYNTMGNYEYLGSK